MKDTVAYQGALARLRELLATRALTDDQYAQMNASQKQVLGRYQPAFASANLEQLTPEEFKSFLSFDNNQHWTGLYRLGWKACENMAGLRNALRTLQDGSRPVGARLDEAMRGVPGMGRALATALLLVMFPDKYGVWNSTSESALKTLGIWPEFERGLSEGCRYERINAVLLDLAEDLGRDLWTLDSLLWHPLATTEADGAISASAANEAGNVSGAVQMGNRFALERHLQDFLFANWDHTDLGREWELYSEDGERDRAVEYPTSVGRIDLLAKHRSQARWLVIELKRDQTSDATVGQVMRYMGWVAAKLAQPGDEVRGLVIAHEADEGMRFALSAASNVSLMFYEIEFRLRGT